ncbi:hypothetical protein RCDURKIN_116 [Rhodobacter phage RcDurkin]|nr:hypothetical protein RCDURKIN_116 [Rhodobacter phage RcDurkin]QXN72585.1 hypothetical protein RCTIPTONUS_115 [Rhodobacter phage RcTiptonus]UUV43859.1 hypothetical protein RCKICKAPOO_118 [Rhodobacter phage RcKickapoo]UUV44486.1 hypothetical protein RCMENCHIE_117 [Rhodobacter phage RcMenchie]
MTHRSITTTTTFLSVAPENLFETTAALKAVGIELDEARLERMSDGYLDSNPVSYVYSWRCDDLTPETAVSTLRSLADHLMVFDCLPDERKFAFVEFVGSDTIAVTHATKFL